MSDENMSHIYVDDIYALNHYVLKDGDLNFYKSSFLEVGLGHNEGVGSNFLLCNLWNNSSKSSFQKPSGTKYD